MLADEGRRSLHPLQIYIIENKISLFLGGALCWRRPQPSDKPGAFRADQGASPSAAAITGPGPSAMTFVFNVYHIVIERLSSR